MSSPSHFSRVTSLLCLFVAFACGLRAEEITLRILCWEGYAPDAQVAIFEKEMSAKHGTTVKVTRSYVSSPEEFFLALRSNKADVISPSHNVPLNKKFPLFPLAHALDLEKLPNYAKINPSLKRLNFHTQGDNVYVVPILYGPYGLAYDRSQLTTAPTSWKALIEPSAAGKFTLSSDYAEVNVYIAALIAGVAPTDLGDFNKLNTPAVKEVLGKLAKGANNMWVGVDKPENFDGCVLGATWGFALPALNEQGKPWALVWPIEGTTGFVDGFMISKHVEKNPLLLAVALDWVNYTLSEEMQLMYMRSIGAFPASTLVANKATPAEVELYRLDQPGFFREKLVLWPVLDERTSNGVTLLWEAAKK